MRVPAPDARATAGREVGQADPAERIRVLFCIPNFSGWRQRAALAAYGRADAVVAVSRGAADAFGRLVPAAAPMLDVIHNGVPVADIRRRATEPLAPEHEPIFSRPVVLNVGRLAAQKRQERLVEIHARLRERGIAHHLVLLGDGPLREALAAQAKALGVGDTVFLPGFQANPFAFMRRAALLALSSDFEGLPLVLAEAMACGAPVVAFDCPAGPAELLDGGRSGVLVPNGDVQAMESAIARLLTDPAEREQKAALSGARADAFDVGAFVARWERVLERVHRRQA